MEELFILDAVSFLFRSYFAIKGMTNARGQSTNALYGFVRSIQKLQKDFAPTALVAVFDGFNNKQMRTELYKEYKKNRVGMPDDLFPQLEWAHRYCIAAGIPYLSEEGVEADDLIGGIAKWGEKIGAKIFICSNDKDLCQLVSDQIVMVQAHKNNLLVDRQKVEELYGVRPEQIVDYLALMGDASDNIPGIPGFGPKTAAALLEEYGSLENIFSSLDLMLNRKQAEKIKIYAQQAQISQKLATLMLDVPYPKEEAFYLVRPPNLSALKALYREMHFNTLLRDLGDPDSVSFQQSKDSASPLRYQTVETEKDLQDLVVKLQGETSICIDTETDSLSPMEGQLVGIGLGVKSHEAWYIPTNGRLSVDQVLSGLQPLFENSQIAFYGHHIKYDLHILKNHGIDVRTIGFDTMVASYLLAPQNNRHNLDMLVLETFGKVKTSIKELIGSGKKAISMREVPIEKMAFYCCEDVDYTCRLKNLFEKQIEAEGLSDVFYQIELPLIPVLLSMERFGIFVEKEKLRRLSGIFRQQLVSLENDIFALAGAVFNIKSPKQLGEVLFNKLRIPIGKKKQSTRAEVLEELKKDYPIAEKILAYRALDKLRSTYAEALPMQINVKTGRIHCTFMQTVTATGRLSCKDPNLQNMPIRSEEGKKIRDAFSPKCSNWVYLSADYSQIELRLLAHLSQDHRLMEAFHKEEDIHASTASAVFDVPLPLVTKEMRNIAKVVNFGIIYGQQAYGLSQELKIEIDAAAAFIERYFEKYPGVREFIERAKEEVRQNGFAKTLFNRKRPIPEIHSKNGMIRSAAERLAVNTPLQGSQADIIKQAMIRIQKVLQDNPFGSMILQIHDELLFELPKEQVGLAEKVIRQIMEKGFSLSVPLTVNITIGKNWGEC